MRRGALWFALFTALVTSLVATAHAADWSDPSCGVMPVVGSASQNRFRLPHTFLRAGSDSVWSRQGPWTRGRDYVLDALRGDLRLLTPLAPGETLWVAACWLVTPPPLEYARQVYRPAPSGDLPAAGADSAAAPAARPATARDVTGTPTGASLALTGNKTVAMDFGSSQDAALRQSLDLAVSGQVAPGVELTGVLSDRNTPLTVGGATQDLQSLDRVLVELKSKQARAALGDIPLALERGAFARLERRVQGVRGDWLGDGFQVTGAAASAQGEYRRMQFEGTDGLQGPYLLTGSDGATGAGVVVGSEVITVEGQRMSRGESADYSMDYERGRLTFTNRRPITSASRITAEYQTAVTRYGRNLAAAATAWDRGPVKFFANAFTEGDDRGEPLDLTLTPEDRVTLASAGDSASQALGQAVTAGIGDYDSVRVAPDTLAYQWAGVDSGQFAVRFTRVGPGLGDYADSAIVAGRVAYAWVGAGRGSYVVGKQLPLPESRRLVSIGGSGRLGAFTLDAEGAVSSFDRNTYSPYDDDDNVGGAARVSLSVEGAAPLLPGRTGAAVGGNSVESRFSPFARLARPFAEQDWGLAPGSDIDHQKRLDASAWWRPREGSELRAEWSRLSTPDGYEGSRRYAEWMGAATLATRLSFLDTDGEQAGVAFGDAGRRRWLGDVRHSGNLLVPSMRFELDERRTPGDSAAVVDRAEEVAADLATGVRPRFRLAGGVTLRRDRHEAGTQDTDRRSSTLRVAGESAPGAAFGVAATAQRRDVKDADTGQRTRSDLASVRLRGENRPTGLSGHYDVEVTGEAENRRVRVLTYVGPGLGRYDEFGNFVGTGDYDMVLAVTPELDRFTRVASSAKARWDFGASSSWRGSRVEFTLEDEARRRGALRIADAFLGGGLALVDTGLARATVTHRIESELAPGSRVAALRVRGERRISTDRSYSNFAQVAETRTGSLRWRARPSGVTTVESELRTQWQTVSQVTPGTTYERELEEDGVLAQLTWLPQPATRLAAAGEVSFSRPQGQRETTRTIRVGPDLGLAVGSRGRFEFTLRRAFISGAPPVALLPGVDPAGAPRWDGTTRFDLRLHETTTVGFSTLLRDYPDRATLVTGRADVRIFF